MRILHANQINPEKEKQRRGVRARMGSSTAAREVEGSDDRGHLHEFPEGVQSRKIFMSADIHQARCLPASPLAVRVPQLSFDAQRLKTEQVSNLDPELREYVQRLLPWAPYHHSRRVLY